MGMDVSGRRPSSEIGEYFRASVWSWHPLAELMLEIAPDPVAKIKHLHSNDGDGLNANDSVLLANTLDQAVEDGRVQAWIAQREAMLAALPMEECALCGGTGVRTDEIGRALGMDVKGVCNSCNPDGTSATPGKTMSFETNYHVDLARVQEFSAFARESGGFKIH